ncbi:unnamed protein product [Prorocentrum cordatum]|uniref:EF-hand domain-containing protein n=1 Tax=Prorocentrum cordatum TaxID=2364126 RepID=A0ABN9X913_9DINO|nr:unnamed protein product [Polarella glacialis]
MMDYGSFSRAFLTMFEISLANWPESCRVLVEDVHELFIIYALLHKMILGFAAVGVVNAVFTQETFKVATLDDGVMVAQTRRRQRAHRQKMETLFKEADLNADGFITIDEWEEICKDDWVQAWLGAQGIESHDTKGLFDLLASDDGTMTAEELVRGTEKLQGAAAMMGVIQRIIDIKRELKHVTGKIEISSAKL